MKRWRCVSASVAAGLLAAAGLAPARAQQAQFRSGVDIVELNVSVTDGRKVVADLAATDFDVFDNGVKQQVVSVTREKFPIDVTLVVDTSRSLSTPMHRAVVNAATRIRDTLKADDRLALVTFNQRVRERQPLQPASAVREFELDAPSGPTVLNDALAIVLSAKPITDRKQMAIVFTDGYDTASFLTEEDVRALAGRSHTAVFVVARQGGWTASPRQPITFFHQVATTTGGVVQIVPGLNVTAGSNWVRIGPNVNLLDALFLKALEDFSSSYVLRYSLEGVSRPGWHEITVKVTKPGNRYVVRARNGYIA